jgi:signal peptidase I
MKTDELAPAPSPSTEVEKEPLLAPFVETWRPPVAVPEPDLATRARRALERRERERKRRAMSALMTSLKLGLILFFTYGLIFNFSIVRGSSMSPGIHDGDRILVDHLTYLFRDVHRSDIVVLQYPLDPSLDYIKRVIGLPGDEILIADGKVFVNGDRLDEPYITEPDARTRLHEFVGADCFFVMGDNRPHSSDSREFGQVPRRNLVGLVNWRVWPPERVGGVN